MAWSATYRADFTKRVIYQLMAFLQRDMRDALDWVASLDGLAEPLPSVVTWQMAPWTIPQYPAALVVPADTVLDQMAVGSRHSESAIFCAIAVAHQDPDICAAWVQDYARALDAVLMSIHFADFFQSWPIALTFTTQNQTLPLEAGTLKELFVIRHNYDEIRRNKDRFACAASLEVRIEREEV
jgi:hypothetical protein